MTCHSGFTEIVNTLVFVPLILAVLRRFLRLSTRVPPFLRAAVCVGASIGLIYHVTMGAICSSTTLSAAVAAHWPRYAKYRIRMLQMTGKAQFLRAVASHVLREAPDERRHLKLAVVNGLALCDTCSVLHWWYTNHDDPHLQTSVVHGHFHGLSTLTRSACACVPCLQQHALFCCVPACWSFIGVPEGPEALRSLCLWTGSSDS